MRIQFCIIVYQLNSFLIFNLSQVNPTRIYFDQNIDVRVERLIISSTDFWDLWIRIRD